jgi:hypothetical protein
MPAFLFDKALRGSSSRYSQRKMSLLNTKTCHRDHSHLSHQLLRSLNGKVLTKCEPDLIAKIKRVLLQLLPAHQSRLLAAAEKSVSIHPFSRRELQTADDNVWTLCSYDREAKTTDPVSLSSTAFGDLRALQKNEISKPHLYSHLQVRDTYEYSAVLLWLVREIPWYHYELIWFKWKLGKDQGFSFSFASVFELS